MEGTLAELERNNIQEPTLRFSRVPPMIYGSRLLTRISEYRDDTQSRQLSPKMIKIRVIDNGIVLDFLLANPNHC